VESFEGGEAEEKVSQSLVTKVEDVTEPIIPAVEPPAERTEGKEVVKEAPAPPKAEPEPVKAVETEKEPVPAPLPDIKCPNCGTINDGAARRCYACGQRRDEESIKALETKKAERAAEEARKEAERKAADERREAERAAEEARKEAERVSEEENAKPASNASEPQSSAEDKKPVSIRKIIKRK
jgi:flagellar biosynthesis GTPase FlhF